MIDEEGNRVTRIKNLVNNVIPQKLFGDIFLKNKVLIDTSLSRYEYVYAAAGHPNTIFKINYKQLIKLTEGVAEEIV